MFKNKKILILGITGSWGYCLTEKLLKFGVLELRGVSRNELNQVVMRRKITDERLKLSLGDIRDYEAVLEASRGVDIVFVLSAYKHVPLGALQPEEFVKTNILGIQNVIKATIANGVKQVIYSSTDKACSSNTLYGSTKFVAEKLMINANKCSKTKFVCVRAGNVLASAGSVVPLFIEQIKENNKVTVTNNKMTRFFMTLSDAIDLLLQATTFSGLGEMFVMRMKSCTLGGLAEVIVSKYGNKTTIIQEIGLRSEEKIHEMLLNESEALNAYELNENYYVVSEKELGFPRVTFKEYGSNTQKLMSKKEIELMLGKAGF